MSEEKRIISDMGMQFFTWSMLFVLFYDFGEIDLYDAIIRSLIS